MTIIIKITYLLVSTVLVLYVYDWSATFKKMGVSTMDEINEDEDKEDMFDEQETRILNYFGTFMFLLIGVLIWSLHSITVGRIASEVGGYAVLRWIWYILIYFFFLRFPFGVGNKMVKRSFDFKILPEKILLIFAILTFYVLAICCYDKIPGFLKWHLTFLDNFSI